MDTALLTCPMCGFAFERGDTLCAHGCPLGALCRLVRCPSCHYEFPETPRHVSWLRRILRRKQAEAPLPADVRSVAELGSGEQAEVVCIGDRSSSRPQTLAAFGLVPGSRITLVQRRPACVLRVGETELALDPEIAACIMIRPRARPARPSR